MENRLPKIRLKVLGKGGIERTFLVPIGETLRAVLLREACSPYQGVFQKINCGGLGICGSCKVRVREGGEWWERRSCQVRCFQDLEIQVQ